MVNNSVDLTHNSDEIRPRGHVAGQNHVMNPLGIKTHVTRYPPQKLTQWYGSLM
jgi:hypothetical protein